MNKTETVFTTNEIISQMHSVQNVIERLRTRYATADRREKYDIQQSLNLWHKDMANLVEQLLAATPELNK